MTSDCRWDVHLPVVIGASTWRRWERADQWHGFSYADINKSKLFSPVRLGECVLSSHKPANSFSCGTISMFISAMLTGTTNIAKSMW